MIIPIIERHDDLARLHGDFAEQLRASGKRFEFLFVVDGPQPGAIDRLRQLKDQTEDPLTVIVLRRPCGEATALAVGFERARGAVIVTLAAYFQVAADGIREAVAMIERGEADLVAGRRFPRKDSYINRAQAVVFHALVSLLTSTRFHDISCGFRVMTREVVTALTLYGDLHRFIPVLALNRGFVVCELKLEQREEDRPMRFYGPGVYLRRMLDILTIFFLVKFTRKPLRFFGLIGSGLFGTGTLIAGYLAIYRLLRFGGIADRPLLLLGVLLMVLGVQSVSIGLLGEIIIFTHARQIEESQVAEII